MDNRDPKLKQLSRSDQVREESKRAAEFGQSPRRPLSLQPNFRFQGLTPAPRPQCSPAIAPGEQFLQLSRAKVVTSLGSNTFASKPSPAYLAERIQHELSRSSDPSHAGNLLDSLAALSNADPHSQITQDLRRKVLTHVFGESFLRSEQSLPKERGAQAIGNSLSNKTGKEA